MTNHCDNDEGAAPAVYTTVAYIEADVRARARVLARLDRDDPRSALDLGVVGERGVTYRQAVPYGWAVGCWNTWHGTPLPALPGDDEPPAAPVALELGARRRVEVEI